MEEVVVRKKVCMIGSFAVGKTSLVSRFVHQLFSERYLTTIGVKIDRKTVHVDHHTVQLLLWDIHGDDEFQRIRDAYLHGAGGFLLVADGTRRTTFDEALLLRERVESLAGPLPFLLLINKGDRRQDWELPEGSIERAREQGLSVRETSAKTGEGVEDSFLELARRMLTGLSS